MVGWKHILQENSEELITFKSSGNFSVIDEVVVNKEVMKRAKDVKVIPGKEFFLRNRLPVMDLA